MSRPHKWISWLRTFLCNIRKFESSEIRILYGVKMGLFLMVVLAMGLTINREMIFACLGTLFIASISISVLEENRSTKSKINTLLVVSILNASAFTIGTIVATMSFLVVSLSALALFIIAYAGVYPNAVKFILVVSLTFSIGIGQSAGSVIAIGEQFLLVLIGGLWGLLGSIIPIRVTHLVSEPRAETAPVYLEPTRFPVTHLERIRPLLSNLSIRSEQFRFAVAIATTGAIGLMIAVDLGLQKQYWVLTTICIIFLRSSISTIFSFTSMRIIGTIIGAAIASVITAYVYYPGLLLSFLFPFATMHLAMSRVNEILATILLSTFVLVLLNIMSHGQMLLAQTRILDTIVGAGLALAGVLALWSVSQWKRL